MKNNSKIEIYAVLCTPENAELINRLNTCFENQQKLGGTSRLMLGIKTKQVNTKNLKTINEVIDYDHCIYYGVLNNRIVCTFTHVYDKVSDEFYLNQATTHPKLVNNGIGTSAYKKVIEHIFKNADITSICASAESDAGRRMLEKLGFMPNSRAFSHGGNAILYSPHTTEEQKFIRLEKLAELCPTRNYINAPNISLYNTKVQQKIDQNNYDELKLVTKFRRTLINYQKATARRSLKTPIAYKKCEKQFTSGFNSEISSFNNKLSGKTFSFEPDLGYNPTVIEIKNALTVIHDIQPTQTNNINNTNSDQPSPLPNSNPSKTK